METPSERSLNQTAFRRLKEKIDKTYPQGRFIAISGGQIIADANGFEELDSLLQKAGKDPAQVLIVQAGVEYPETAIIFSLLGAV
jgi:hypothetical protein